MRLISLAVVVSILLLSACQSNLQKAGRSHALTFSKWQELSRYAGKSYLSSQVPIRIVGELTIEQEDQRRRFVLTNIRLAKQETPYQINLLHPQFEEKYICTPQCLQLTEYLLENTESNTLLTRYFKQQEFELFKFYGEVFSLDKEIQQVKAIDERYFQHYIDWLIFQRTESGDIQSFITYLKSAFSEQAYVSFISDPQKLYSHLMHSVEVSEESSALIENGEWLNTPAVETEFWSDAQMKEQDNWSDAQVKEQDNWSDAQVKEQDNWSDEPTNESDTWRSAETSVASLKPEPRFDNQAEQDWQAAKNLNIELGDLVCSTSSDEFGSVQEIRGKTIVVEVVGNTLSLKDGVSVASSHTDVFNDNVVKRYVPVESKVKRFDREQVSICYLE
ncbi:hypothetical protein [Paraglaciecola sp. L1A13]|uniref:hypothetical protein n=1 Tax=Paraglaciecola sp. L1A13 TaxID=2686359 RepID=UPI00131C888F|nr:hypothetical protein [Paraglaciecola sp. L1A13]